MFGRELLGKKNEEQEPKPEPGEAEALARLEARARRGSREKFLEILARVPHGDPGDDDRI